jgi:hypothetical protein
VKKFLSFSFLAAALLIVTVPMFAHHGTAVYDNAKSIVLKGTVTKFDFVNPHILVYIDAPDAGGTMRNWVIENSPPSLAMHSGWFKDMMKPGDKIEYKVNPARNGAFVGRGGSPVTINGKLLGGGAGGGAAAGGGAPAAGGGGQY